MREKKLSGRGLVSREEGETTASLTSQTQEWGVLLSMDSLPAATAPPSREKQTQIPFLSRQKGGYVKKTSSRQRRSLKKYCWGENTLLF